MLLKLYTSNSQGWKFLHSEPPLIRDWMGGTAPAEGVLGEGGWEVAMGPGGSRLGEGHRCRRATLGVGGDGQEVP